MSATTAPRITINGNPLKPVSDHAAQRIGLERVTIRWGRELITDEPEPSASTIELLEFGDAASWNFETFIGAEVVITRNDGRHLLRGRVTAQESEETRAPRDARTMADAIRTTLTITDVWGMLEATRPRGPYAGAPVRGQGGTIVDRTFDPYGNGGWPHQTTAQRIDKLRPHAALFGVNLDSITESWGLSRESPSQSTSPSSRQRGTDVADLETLAELVRRCYAAARPLGWAELVNGDRITQGQPVNATRVLLRGTGTTSISLVIPAATTSVASQTITTPDRGSLPQASTANRIATVRVDLDRKNGYFTPLLQNATTGEIIRQRGVNEDDESTTFSTLVPGAGGSSTEHRINAGASASFFTPVADDDTSTPTNVWEGDAAARQLVEQSARLLGNLNDWLSPPTLVARGLTGPLITTSSLGPVILRGNRFATWASVPAQYQLIGGILEWDALAGIWEHELTLAPTIDPARRILTSAEVWGPITTPISKLDPNIDLLDLCLVNEVSEQI